MTSKYHISAPFLPFPSTRGKFIPSKRSGSNMLSPPENAHTYLKYISKHAEQVDFWARRRRQLSDRYGPGHCCLPFPPCAASSTAVWVWACGGGGGGPATFFFSRPQRRRSQTCQPGHAATNTLRPWTQTTSTTPSGANPLQVVLCGFSRRGGGGAGWKMFRRPSAPPTTLRAWGMKGWGGL